MFLPAIVLIARHFCKHSFNETFTRRVSITLICGIVINMVIATASILGDDQLMGSIAAIMYSVVVTQIMLRSSK